MSAFLGTIPVQTVKSRYRACNRLRLRQQQDQLLGDSLFDSNFCVKPKKVRKSKQFGHKQVIA